MRNPNHLPVLTACGVLASRGSTLTIAEAWLALRNVPFKPSPIAELKGCSSSDPEWLDGSGASTAATVKNSGFISRPPHWPLSKTMPISEVFSVLECAFCVTTCP